MAVACSGLGVMGAGFVFLAADDAFLIHENLDFKIHAALGIETTTWTDRIDDILIGVYGVVGLAVLFIFPRRSCSRSAGRCPTSRPASCACS